ncbi:MAG TPA: NAD-dependent epimerase/dehydratase family protein [Arthrobacter sp.]|nr:NAD-dependent epimerase/dehydratase family protein [Arthrobacter sp.]
MSTEPPPPLPVDTDTVIIATSADGRTEEAYRRAYEDSLRHVLDAIDRDGLQAAKVLMISSTAVYGARNGDWVDEQTPASPHSATAEILFKAEELLLARSPNATVLRLAGIYGPGRTRLIDQVKSGAARKSGAVSYTNRIHRDDAAAAIVHLASLDDPARLYLGVDDEPADRTAVLEFLAREMEAAPLAETGGNAMEPPRDHKRCSNALLKSTGFSLKYPTYREGYRSVLNNEGTKHG